LLPYFYTADPTFLPQIEGYRKYYISPLDSAETKHTEILRRLQPTVGEWLPELYRYGPEELLRSYQPPRTTHRIGKNVTSIPVRVYASLHSRCIQCGKVMHFPDADDPHWYDGNALCDQCQPETDTCVLCGRESSPLGVCLPCISHACQASPKLQSRGVFSTQKSAVVAACTGTYRLPDQHFCVKGDFFYELEEVTLPQKKVCQRCGEETYFTNRGCCYPCRATLYKQEKRRNVGKEA
jgi:hypothetical protein